MPIPVTMKKSRRIPLMTLATSALALLLPAAPHGDRNWPVPEEARKHPNPVKATPQVLAAAKKNYLELCIQCHGESGKGDGTGAMMYTVKPANFTDTHMMQEMTDGEIFYKMSEGRRPMPGFKNNLSEEQRWQLVHFVRTFSKAAPAKPAKAPAHKH